jgi:hypothetical protein
MTDASSRATPPAGAPAAASPLATGDYGGRYFSKWNHADIIALVEAGSRLLSAGDEVRTTLVVDDIADFTIYRACIFAVGILHANKIIYCVSVDTLGATTEKVNSLRSK